MSTGENFAAAISHWLIEPRTARVGDLTPFRRMIVAADSAAAARQYAEHWRMTRPYSITGPFTDQRHYVVRRLPGQLVDEPRRDAGVVHSEMAQA
ncbi:hypothetical protein [Emcibacter sp. SYSU 3D8]|uniref:hypothetical protein n=1 Tax=Emcibacter sp. SYSU 3D8 TaxID=3133969 RepID=UPI0031FF1B2A